MYLDKVELKEDYICFDKGFNITDFRNITLLVGDQGSGKSTLLKLLGSNDKVLDVKLLDGVEGCSTFYFDSEHMNPRTKDPELYTKPNGDSIGIGYGGALASRFKSHGEILVDFTVNALKKAKDAVIFLDEPESGLSLRNQYNLIQAIEKASKNNCQILIATHCLPLIESQKKVYSMEHRKWMNTKKFLKTQM